MRPLLLLLLLVVSPARAGGTERVPWLGHAGPIVAVDGTPDGERVVSADESGRVLLWDLPTGRVVRTLQVVGVRHVRLFQGGRALLTAGTDGVLRRFDLATGRLDLELHGHYGGITSLALTYDGHAVTTGVDDTLRAWKLASGRQDFVYYLRGQDVLDVRADGLLLLGHGNGGDFGRAAMGESLRVLDLPRREGIARVPTKAGVAAWLADGRSVATHEQEWQRWSARPAPLPESVTKVDAWPAQIVPSPDRSSALVRSLSRVAVAGAPMVFEVRHLEDGALETVLTGISNDAVVAWPARIVVGGKDGSVGVWDPGMGQRVLTLRGAAVQPATLTALGDDAALLAGTDGELLRLDPMTGAVQVLGDLHEPVAKVALDETSRRAATASAHTITTWDLARATKLAVFRLPDDETPAELRILQGGDRVALVSDRSWPDERKILRLIDFATGKVLGPMRPALELQPFGARHVVQESERGWTTIDTTTGTTVQSAGRACGPRFVAFSPDGRRIALVDSSGEVRVLDSASLRVLWTWSQGPPEAERLLWSPDGTELLVTGVHGQAQRARVGVGAVGPTVLLAPASELRLWVGTYVAALDDHQSVFVYDLRTGSAVAAPGPADIPAIVRVWMQQPWGGQGGRHETSPDGGQFAVSEFMGSGLSLWAPAENRVVARMEAAPSLCGWTGDGRLVALCGPGGLELRSATDLSLVKHLPGVISAGRVALDTAGDRVVFVGGLGWCLRDLRTGIELPLPKPAVCNVDRLSPMPDGTGLVVADPAGVQWVTPAGKRTTIMPAPGTRWAVAPRGGVLVTCAQGVLAVRQGSGPAAAVGTCTGLDHVTWSADGGRVAIADEKEVVILDVADRRVVGKTPAPAGRGELRVRLDARGTRLGLQRARASEVTVLDVDTGKLWLRTDCELAEVSADGQHLRCGSDDIPSTVRVDTGLVLPRCAFSDLPGRIARATVGNVDLMIHQDGSVVGCGVGRSDVIWRRAYDRQGHWLRWAGDGRWEAGPGAGGFLDSEVDGLTVRP